MHETATQRTIHTSRYAPSAGRAVRVSGMQFVGVKAKAIGEGIMQMFRGLVHGVWTCPHDELGFDDIGDIYCKRCNRNLMD